MAIYPTLKFKIDDLIKDNRTTLSNIEIVKKWLQINPNIPDMAPEQISLFLIACNNDTAVTTETISKYFKYKSEAPELFYNRNLDREDMQLAFKVTKFALFPKRTKEGYCIALACLRDTCYYRCDLTVQIKCLFMTFDLALHENPPHGLIFILDLKGVGIMHLTRLKPWLVKKFFQYLQEALQSQLKGIYILNSNYVFDKALLICKPFMNEELYKLIITHAAGADMDDFFEKHLPRECMPEDYGGRLPSVETLCNETHNNLRQIEAYFEMDQKQTETYKPRKQH